MIEDDRNGHSRTAQADRVASVRGSGGGGRPPRRGILRRRRRRRPRGKIRWLRLLLLLVPLSFLALISFVFGIVLAYAPQIQGLTAQLKVQYTNGVASTVYSEDGKEIGILTAGTQVFLPPSDIPPVMRDAIISIEDKRFYSEPGVDIKGIARAFVADVFGGNGRQGASTITEQFVKLALHEEQNRTVLEKLREAALAFQLAHLWTKPTILADYLDTAYFGNGAYGVEAAARAYFSRDPNSNLYGCGKFPRPNHPASLCVTKLTPDEAALLAASVDAPSAFNGLANASAAQARRNLVLQDMAEQHYLTPSQEAVAAQTSLPAPRYVGLRIQEGTNKSDAYFVNWIENQLLQNPKYKKNLFTAGYHIHTTLNIKLQEAAYNTVRRILPPGIGGPSAALVAIDNRTGEVRAMFGGYNFYKDPYNLATQGERQPGSSFKVFDLAAALNDGYKPSSKVYSGAYDYTEAPYGTFAVRNDEGGYYHARIPLSLALAVSDNSVFSRVGLQVGTRNIAKLANLFGITTTVSFNPSMVIGGLHIGVTPLDMAHAYETIAQDGVLTSGSLASETCANGWTVAYQFEENPPVGAGEGGSCPGPVGIAKILQPTTKLDIRNEPVHIPVYSATNAEIEKNMMKGVLRYPGTAAAAAIPGVAAWGKTGTTNNYYDAWFVGSTPKVGKVPSMTVAVWVGFPQGAKSMAKDYHGSPVYGGTYPAQIWKAYVTKAMYYYEHPATHHHTTGKRPAGATGATSQSVTTSTSSSAATGATTPASTGGTPTPATGATTHTGGGTTAQNTNTPAAGGTTTPAVTSGGGSTIPAGNTPTTTPVTTTPATTTPVSTTPVTTTPGTTTPATTTGSGGVTAPTGGASAPSG